MLLAREFLWRPKGLPVAAGLAAPAGTEAPTSND
jgi:hypothetical protein